MDETETLALSKEANFNIIFWLCDPVLKTF